MKFAPYDWSEKDMIGGNAALDFVNTVSNWNNGQAPADRLEGPLGFGEWAGLAGLLDEEDLSRLKKQVQENPKAAADIYKQAQDLRAALWRIFNAIATKENANPDDLAALDQWKARSAHHCRIVQDGDGFRRRCKDEAPALERALRLIVEAAEALLLNGRLDRIHNCGGDACEWMFIDLSKNGRRRWCSMATCGNEAKVKKFRKQKNKSAA